MALTGGGRGFPPRQRQPARGAPGRGGARGAGERRGLLTILVERGLKPREGAVALRQADPVNRQVVHETSVEHVLASPLLPMHGDGF